MLDALLIAGDSSEPRSTSIENMVTEIELLFNRLPAPGATFTVFLLPIPTMSTCRLTCKIGEISESSRFLPVALRTPRTALAKGAT